MDSLELPTSRCSYLLRAIGLEPAGAILPVKCDVIHLRGRIGHGSDGNDTFAVHFVLTYCKKHQARLKLAGLLIDPGLLIAASTR